MRAQTYQAEIKLIPPRRALKQLVKKQCGKKSVAYIIKMVGVENLALPYATQLLKLQIS